MHRISFKPRHMQLTQRGGKHHSVVFLICHSRDCGGRGWGHNLHIPEFSESQAPSQHFLTEVNEHNIIGVPASSYTPGPFFFLGGLANVRSRACSPMGRKSRESVAGADQPHALFVPQFSSPSSTMATYCLIITMSGIRFLPTNPLGGFFVLVLDVGLVIPRLINYVTWLVSILEQGLGIHSFPPM